MLREAMEWVMLAAVALLLLSGLAVVVLVCLVLVALPWLAIGAGLAGGVWVFQAVLTWLAG